MSSPLATATTSHSPPPWSYPPWLSASPPAGSAALAPGQWRTPSSPQVRAIPPQHVPPIEAPDGANPVNRAGSRGVENKERREISEEGEIAEFFGQLWLIPSEPPPKPRVPSSQPHGGSLFWISRDLVRNKSFEPKDCSLLVDLIGSKLSQSA